MSSKKVREEILNYMRDNLTDPIIDLTARFGLLESDLREEGIDFKTNWIAVQFIGQSEEAISINEGCFREYGTVYIAIVGPAKKDIKQYILDKSEEIRSLLRGKRLDKITIESVDPVNFEGNALFDMKDGWISGHVTANYYYDIKED